MSTPIPLTVVGAGGMLIGEALRLIEMHPGLSLRHAVARGESRRLIDLQPHLGADWATETRTVDLAAATRTLREDLADPAARAAILLGLPHGETASTWRALREELGEASSRLHVVDLSADYRLRDPDAYARWYGTHADPDELSSFRYGLPELAAEPLPGALRIAAPGCFATALQLACIPAAAAELLDPEQTWTLTAVTGSSGSGVKPGAGTHHPFRSSDLWAYGLGGHRHEAELEQALGFAPPLAFIPQSGPFVRGIHLTAVLPVRPDVSLERARGVYRDCFRERPFVEVLEDDEVPHLRTVVGSNRASLAVHAKPGALVVLVALDNIVKGGAGQALQALNLALGWPEDLCLPRTGMGAA